MNIASWLITVLPRPTNISSLCAKNNSRLKPTQATSHYLVTPWVLSLIMIRDHIQRSSILTAVSRDDAYYVWVRAHDDLSILCQNTPPHIVSDNTGNKVSPMIEIES